MKHMRVWWVDSGSYSTTLGVGSSHHNMAFIAGTPRAHPHACAHMPHNARNTLVVQYRLRTILYIHAFPSRPLAPIHTPGALAVSQRADCCAPLHTSDSLLLRSSSSSSSSGSCQGRPRSVSHKFQVFP